MGAVGFYILCGVLIVASTLLALDLSVKTSLHLKISSAVARVRQEDAIVRQVILWEKPRDKGGRTEFTAAIILEYGQEKRRVEYREQSQGLPQLVHSIEKDFGNGPLEIHLVKPLLKTTDAGKYVENNSHLQYLAGLGPRTQSYAPVPIVYAAETPSFFQLKSKAGSLSHVVGRLGGLLAVEIIGTMLALALIRKIPGITERPAAMAGFILFNIIPILGFMFPGRFYNPSQPQDPGKPAIVVDEMFNRSRLIEQLELWLSKS